MRRAPSGASETAPSTGEDSPDGRDLPSAVSSIGLGASIRTLPRDVRTTSDADSCLQTYRCNDPTGVVTDRDGPIVSRSPRFQFPLAVPYEVAEGNLR